MFELKYKHKIHMKLEGININEQKNNANSRGTGTTLKGKRRYF